MDITEKEAEELNKELQELIQKYNGKMTYFQIIKK